MVGYSVGDNMGWTRGSWVMALNDLIMLLRHLDIITANCATISDLEYYRFADLIAAKDKETEYEAEA
jgi:hypothetical protein